MLNATAELSALGELFIQGDASDDFVQLDVQSDGDIQLSDAAGDVVPIRTGTDSSGGGIFVDSIATADVTGGLVSIDLGGGDDTLQLEIPRGLNVTVVDGDGVDQTDVKLSQQGSGDPETTIRITSDLIRFSEDATSFIAQNRTLDFSGHVVIGSSSSATELSLESSSLRVDGTWTTDGTVRVSAVDSRIQFDEAIVSANSAGTSLLVSLDASSTASFGGVNSSAGSTLSSLVINGGSSVRFGSAEVNVGEFVVTNADQLFLSSEVNAASIQISADSVDLDDATLLSDGAVELDGSIDVAGVIEVRAGDSLSIDAQVVESTGATSLSLVANDDLVLRGRISGGFAVDATAGRQLTVTGSIVGPSDLTLSGDRIELRGDLTASAIHLAGETFAPNANIVATDGSISLDGRGALIDLSSALLATQQTGASVIIGNASAVDLGSVAAPLGTLHLGSSALPITGDVIQTQASRIEVATLSASASGALTLAAPMNRISRVSNATTTGGSIELRTQGNLLIGRIDSGKDVFLSADTINDAANDSDADIFGGNVALAATEGIGQRSLLALGGVETVQAFTERGDVNLLLDATSSTRIASLQTGAGDILVRQTGGQTMTAAFVRSAGGDVVLSNDAALRIGRIEAEGSAITLVGRSIDDATADADPDLIAESLILEAVSGIGQNESLELLDVRTLRAVSDAGDIELDWDANSSTRIVSLQTGAGDISVRQTGGPTLAVESVITADGSIELTADADLSLGMMDAGVGSILLSAESINRLSTGGNQRLIAEQVELIAKSGIGIGNPVQIIGGSVLNASTESGGVALDWRSVGPTRVADLQSGGAVRIVQTGGQRLTIESLQVADGDATIENVGASVAVGSGASAGALLATSGNIDLSATGSASDVVIDGIVSTDTGSISVSAGNAVRQLGRSTVTSNEGPIRLTAGADTDALSASVQMEDGALITSETGSVSLTAPGDIIVAALRSGSSQINTLSITSRFGEIIDGGDADLDLISPGGAVINSASGIGAANQLETQLGWFSGQVHQSGDVALAEVDELTVIRLVTADGGIVVTAGGTLTLQDVVSQNSSGVDDDPNSPGSLNRDIVLTTTGPRADLLVGRIVARRGADVFLTSSDDILDTDANDQSVIQADDLRVFANNSSGDGPNAISLTTEVRDLDASVRGNNRGDLAIRELDSINLGSWDGADDRTTVSTTNGEIRIIAGGRVTIQDLDPFNDGVQLQTDPELDAGGANGRITVVATELIASDSVQLQAAQTTSGAVFVAADALTVGDAFEINTGNGTGVARAFTPRPAAGLTETAFYEFPSIRTDVLTQAGPNNAQGTLTVNVGATGENGLVMIIDWGAETGRFQQVAGLPGGGAEVNVSHVYTEADILFSTLNGRTSSTDPLNVRFAVQHHPSIVVMASTVTQADRPPETIEGGLASSTDNPLTRTSAGPVLENGTASFIVPNINVPVDFVPVRQVLPPPAELEPPVVVPTTFVVIESDFETSETVFQSLAVRDEYFQLRTLSPDPQGNDLSPPLRLPADILSADNLTRLFSQLPDGQYEIEYVLGDGNERLILRVDLRDGRPIVPADDLEAGTLRLESLDPNEIDSDGDAGNAAVTPQDERPQAESDEGGDEPDREDDGTAVDAPKAFDEQQDESSTANPESEASSPKPAEPGKAPPDSADPQGQSRRSPSGEPIRLTESLNQPAAIAESAIGVRSTDGRNEPGHANAGFSKAARFLARLHLSDSGSS